MALFLALAPDTRAAPPAFHVVPHLEGLPMTGVSALFLPAAGRLRIHARRALRLARGRVRLLAALAAGLTLAAGMVLQAAPVQATAAVLGPAPSAQKPVPVQVVHGHKARLPVMTSWKQPATRWPAPASGTAVLAAVPPKTAVAAAAGVGVKAGTRLPAGNAALGAVRSGEQRAGSLPVWAGQVSGTAKARAVGKIAVTMAPRSAAAAAGVKGVIFTVARDDGGTGPGQVQVNLDYAGFADAYGSGYAARLRLVTLPACALTTPQVAACRKQTPLSSADDVQAGSLGADVTVPGQKTASLVATAAGKALSAAALPASPAADTVVAATSAPSGSAGSFTATSLSEAGQWTAGGSNGSFDYSYPITVPDVPGGLEPSVSLDYDSQSVDGLTSSTNDQASWVGDGWDYEPGYIERDYSSCETEPPNSTGWVKSGDLCWSSDDTTTLSLGGQNTTLVQDAATGAWHAEVDNGDKIQYLTGAGNSTGDGGYWVVTTPDGTSYYFGEDHLPGWVSGDRSAGSSLNVPVYAYQSGTPCGTAKSCYLPWQWNLDYVTDAHGDAMALFYNQEDNYYARDNGTTGSAQYQQGAALSMIEYGLRAGDVYGSTAGTLATPAAEVTFTSGTSRTDIPSDLACASGAACDVISPTFWDKYELNTITTDALDGSSLKEVDSWALAHSYPNPGDATTSPSLWLDSVTRTGEDGTAVSLPPETFLGTPLPNRIETAADLDDGYSIITRLRLTDITSETGGVTTVNYLAPSGGCTSGTLPAPDDNTLLCYPDYWQPSTGEPAVEDWFSKYVVNEVTEQDQTGNQPDEVTTYSYGGAAWHYDDDALTRSSQRTWDQWRGFRTVTTKTGPAASPDTETVDTYFQGMNGDYQSGGSASSVSLTSSQGNTVTDEDQYAGMDFEHVVDDGPGGAMVTDTITIPWTSAATATQTQPSPLPALTAYMTGTAETYTYTALASGGNRESTVTNTHDSYGRVTQVSSVPDTTDAAEDTCTTTAYASNTSKWIMDLPAEVSVVSVPCGTAPSLPADAVSDELTFYDGATSLSSDTPTAGEVTETQEATSYTGSAPVYTTESKSTYDEYGRVLTSANADGDTTTTAYTPATGAEPTSVSVTDPMGLKTTTTYDPLRELPLTVTSPAGWTSTEEYDSLGRLTAAWTDGHGTGGPAQYEYTYDVSSTQPSVVTTETLEPSGTAYLPSETIYDSLGQAAETQTENADGDTVVTDTYYNSDGWTVKTSGPYYITGAPTGKLEQAPDDEVPAQTADVYDGAGRVTRAESYSLAQETWETDTAYGGDYTTTTYQNLKSGEPDGGTPETVFTNGEGQTSAIYQYHSEADAALGPAAPASDYDKTAYSYTPAGQLASITDDAGNTWKYGYNLAGDQTSETDPDAGTTTSTYDAAGLLTSTTAAPASATQTAGDQVSYVYDADGRKTAEYNTTDGQPETSATELASWVYDTLAKGELTSSTSYYDGSAYTEQAIGYDGYGLSKGTETIIPAAQGALAGTYIHENTTYNPYDGLLEDYEDTGDGGLPVETVEYGYNAAGGQASVSGIWDYVDSLSYTDLGQPGKYTYGSSAEPAWTVDSYDEQTGSLTQQETQAGTTPVTVDDQNYGYDNTGQITSDADTPTAGKTQVQCYQYDYLGRLTQAWSQGTAGCSSGPSQSAESGATAPYWEQYSYNDENDMTSETSTPVSGAATTTTDSYPAAGSPQPHAITSQTVTTPSGSTTTDYGHDGDGQLTSESGSDSDSLSWNDTGQLASMATSAGTTNYIYDADGNLLLQEDPGSTTLYLSDEEVTLTGSTLSATRYYQLGGQSVAARTSAGDVYYLTGNQEGTETLAINSASLAVSERFYDPYGNPVGTATGTWPGNEGFESGTSDTATELTNLDAREYDSGTASFISPDSLLDPTDPQDLNAYAYAEDTPPTGEDPSGAITVGPPGSGCTTGTEYIQKCGGNGNPSPSGGGGQGKAPSGAGDNSQPGTPSVAVSPHVDVTGNLPQAHALQVAWEAVTHAYSGSDEYSNWVRLCVLYRSLCTGDLLEIFSPMMYPSYASDAQGLFGAGVKLLFGGNEHLKGYYFPILGSSATLGRRLVKSGEVRYPGYEAHHIVAENNPDASPAQKVLQDFGIDVNSSANGVFLPATPVTANPTGSVVHRGDTLTNEYIQYVNDQMGEATTREEALEVLQAIKDDLVAGNMPWMDDGGDAAAVPGE
jgi:RHS repeat-associated protein